MTIKQQIKYGAIQKLYRLHNDIFQPIQIFHTLSILPYHFPCYSLNFTKNLQNERKEDFLHIWLLQCIMLYESRQKSHLQTQLNFETHAYVQRTHIDSETIIFLCKYYTVILDKPIDSFLDVLFLLPAVIFSGLCEKPSFLCNFLLLSLSSSFPFPSDVLVEWLL